MSGLYFEEFEVGRVFKHAITRTITETDNLIFCALTHNPQPVCGELLISPESAIRHTQVLKPGTNGPDSSL
jgi:hypothetical protein